MKHIEHGTQIDVLDHGYVKLVDHIGDDSRVVFAARRSVQDPTKKNRPDDQLIDYLIRNRHMSPLEHCSVTFEVKMPIFVARQALRHRTGKFAEMSLRYSSPKELDFYLPTSERIAEAGGHENIYNLTDADDLPTTLTEGSIVDNIARMQDEAMDLYLELQEEFSWPSELARCGLPQSMYTNVLFTMDLRNLLHFLKERLSSHAQYEIRVYAEAMLAMVEELYPVSVSAWKKHDLNSLTLSEHEAKGFLEVLHSLYAVGDPVFEEQRLDRIFWEKVKDFKKKVGA